MKKINTIKSKKLILFSILFLLLLIGISLSFFYFQEKFILIQNNQSYMLFFQGKVNLSGKGSGGDTIQEEAKGKWWRTYFTTPNSIVTEEENDVAQGFIDLINHAQETIHIAGFEADYLPIATALVSASKRGVEVIWITDDEYGIEADLIDENYFFKTLQDADINVMDDHRSALMHNKFAIFDQSIVWTGSTNFTYNGFTRNNNNAIWIKDVTVAEIFENEFDEMVDGNFGPFSPSYQYKQLTKVDGSRIIILFGSEDSTINEINYYLNNAKQNIVMMTFSFTHDDMGDILVEKIRQGVTVANIFEKRGSMTEYSELPRLYCAGAHVRQDGNPGSMHHKVIIIDGEIVITGSLNFTQNATQKNDENVVIIYDPQIAESYIHEFERLWYDAVVPPVIECNQN
jgi:phosphatidylserine/phosphatidylglycerophosphate/cardiolipin synthase-like enzyme